MCGRYVLYIAPHKLKDLFGTENLPNFPPSYNAAPLQEHPIVIKNRIGMARWGFVPSWAKQDDKGMAAKMINARSETVAEKASFRESWERGRRCLIPANGFYEWKKDEASGINQPYYIQLPEQQPMAFAGLWAKNGDLVTYTILTKPADGMIAGLHHRMPVTITPDQAAQWFAADADGARVMIGAASGQDFSFYAVGSDVGRVANDSEDLIVPLRA